MKIFSFNLIILLVIMNIEIYAQDFTVNGDSLMSDTLMHPSPQYTISTDRPSASFASLLVPKGILQAELGYFHQITSFHQTNQITDKTMPNLLIRYSPIKNLEVRLATDYYQNVINNDSVKISTSGVNPTQLGFKLHLKKEDGIIPQITFLGSTYIGKLASQPFQFQGINPYFRFMFQNTVSEQFFVLYNLGMDFNTPQKLHQYIYTFMFGYLPTTNLTLFFEVFGYKSKQLRGLDYLPHVGAIYVINNRYQLDATLGYLFAQYQEFDNLKNRLFFQVGFSTYFKIHS